MMGTSQAETYVLVSGAWLDSWYWAQTKEELEASGHLVLAPDLPGHGANNAPLGDQTLDDYARYVAQIINQQNEPVILVGHSMGGAVASQATEFAPDKVKELVVVCGFLPRNGESVNGPQDGIKPTDWIKAGTSGAVRLSEDHKVTFLKEDAIREKFLFDIDVEVAQKALSHISGESIAAQYQPTHLGDAFARIPKSYVKTLSDRGFPPELQDKMIERNVSHVYTIKSGHFPQLAKPTELAKALLDVATHKEQ